VKIPFFKTYLLEGVHIMVQLGILGMGGTIITICEIVCVSNKKMNPSNTLNLLNLLKFFHIFFQNILKHKNLHFSKFMV